MSGMAKLDPSHIMKLFQREKPDDWGSLAANPFCLDESPRYAPHQDSDPSDIVHIIQFGTKRSLTQPNAPLFYNIMEEDASCYTSNISATTPPLIADTGASVCISPLRSDFVTYHRSNIAIKDLSSSNAVTGEGMIHWHVIDTNGNHFTIY
jgi:hypothetical protein